MSIFRTLHLPLEERAVEYVDGRFTRVIDPGRHRRRSKRRAQYRRVWMPQRVETLSPQDVLTSEGVTVRVSVATRWAVGDPRLFVEVAHDPAAIVYLTVQVALREALVGYDVERAVRESRGPVGLALTEAARAAGAEVGVEVREVVVKDVIL